MQQNENVSSPDNKPERFHSYLNNAASIIKAYNGSEPFHLFIKKYFSANKKYGSTDRKIITALCYSYFRARVFVREDIDISEKILILFFLCTATSSNLLESLHPDLNASIAQPVEQKFQLIKDKFIPANFFPFSEELSKHISKEAFALSFLKQPKLFIRIRPGYKNAVTDKLNRKEIPFQQTADDCFAFTNAGKIDQILEIDKEAVIQDYNSQKTLDLVTAMEFQFPGEIHVWDCCAGSGGKSILAYDKLHNIKLTVSDKRKSILHNLEKRFKMAGIKNYRLLLSDLEKKPSSINQRFDLIVSDVPCSGSGTWSRTPEQLTFFNPDRIKAYSLLQQDIVNHVLPNLSVGGYLLYITCSVFKKENEENVQLFRQSHHLELIEMKYYQGYEMQSDSMFAALLKKEK